jgi:ubiquinone/menaquinone biosynthesis C-methylase UbiE
MKTRESGMPSEEIWRSFFDPLRTLQLLGLTRETCNMVDFGCGYGTFTIPAARYVRGVVHAFDIEPEMIEESKRKAEAEQLTNVRFYLRDFMAEGTGLLDSAIDYVMLFNILHAEEPLNLLREAHRILTSGGKMGVMHWNYDPKTPRGPSMEIRPKPEDCRRWVDEAGFTVTTPHIDLPPYHYGFVGQK